MNLFETAKQIELEGEQSYRKLAENATDEGLRTIFTLLAENEVEHYKAFDEMERKAELTFSGTDFIREAKDVFQGMTKRAASYNENTPQEEVYKAALLGEQKSVEFYNSLLQKEEDKANRAVIEQIISEEKNHVRLLENMVDFLEQPMTWLENAEFAKIEEY